MDDMNGRTVLVTGATDGIGRATALGLARQGAHVLVHGRDATRVAETVQEVRTAARSAHGAGAEGLVADLAVQAEVRRLAAEVTARPGHLDVLINNAGVVMRERQLTQDGVESTLAVNYLAPFLLTNLLVGELGASSSGRVVNVGSRAHLHALLDFDDLQCERHWVGNRAYGASKLALMLYTVEIAERLASTQVTVNALHPGVVKTKLLMAGWSWGSFAGLDVAQGARTSIYLASSPEVAGVSGAYYSDLRPMPPSRLVWDVGARRRLWELSEQLVGLSETPALLRPPSDAATG
jgi:NAD(P)-dependent dehydrogenase (short-subunit alcohol dehydrogenase family)